MKSRHRHQEPRRSWFSTAWGLFFSVNDRFISYQQRRNWRARASFFFVLGIVLAVAVQWYLGRRLGFCPR